MKVKSLKLSNFTVFEEIDFDFCDGINLFLGANGTGKTHILKAIYSFLKAGEEAAKRNIISEEFPGDVLNENFIDLFKPADSKLKHLIREKKNSKESIIALSDEKKTYEFRIYDPKMNRAKHLTVTDTWDLPKTISCLFLPSGEGLAMYEGFTSSYEKRELSFDKTYYDLAKSLSATPLKKTPGFMNDVMRDFEKILGGEVILKGNRFWLKTQDREIEAHLIAEGHRKLAMLLHLIYNGSLSHDTILFWDEPESHLNPKLIKKIADVVLTLAKQGLQIFLATHDYLLSSEISLEAEYHTNSKVPIKFFALSKESPLAPVKVQIGDSLPEIKENPILEEFAAHYEREQELSIKSLQKGKTISYLADYRCNAYGPDN